MIATVETVCRVLAVCCFAMAAYIDRPWAPPSRDERNQGNFCCSLGFLFLAASMGGGR